MLNKPCKYWVFDWDSFSAGAAPNKAYVFSSVPVRLDKLILCSHLHLSHMGADALQHTVLVR